MLSCKISITQTKYRLYFIRNQVNRSCLAKNTFFSDKTVFMNYRFSPTKENGKSRSFHLLSLKRGVEYGGRDAGRTNGPSPFYQDSRSGDRPMKKLALFCAIAMAISTVSTGCTFDPSSLCRSGSLFPTSRSKQQTERVYMTSAQGSQCDPCAEVSACNPCDPCNPCDMSCNGVISGGIVTPHPVN